MLAAATLFGCGATMLMASNRGGGLGAEDAASGSPPWLTLTAISIVCAWLGSFAAALAPALMIRRPAQDVAAAALLGLGMRFGVTLAAGLLCRGWVGAGWVGALLIGVALAQLLMLVVDVISLVRLARGRFPMPSPARSPSMEAKPA